VHLEPRKLFVGLLIAGIAAAVLLLPAISLVGNMVLPSPLEPATAPVPPVLADAIWARANGGRATELQAINPFTIGRTVSCLVLAERLEPSPQREAQEECMTLLPGIEAVSYLTNTHLQSVGVWQDARVPFAGIATMRRVADRWTRADLLNTLAARGQFGGAFVGAETAALGYFGRPAADLTPAQAALLAATLGDRPADPWCDPETASRLRHRVLVRMRNNGAIDEATFQSADRAELGLAAPPAGHKPCEAPRAGS
jgi:hypothetical protein